jgi:hypothetical protein
MGPFLPESADGLDGKKCLGKKKERYDWAK